MKLCLSRLKSLELAVILQRGLGDDYARYLIEELVYLHFADAIEWN